MMTYEQWQIAVSDAEDELNKHGGKHPFVPQLRKQLAELKALEPCQRCDGSGQYLPPPININDVHGRPTGRFHESLPYRCSECYGSGLKDGGTKPPKCSECQSDARRQKCLHDLGGYCPRHRELVEWEKRVEAGMALRGNHPRASRDADGRIHVGHVVLYPKGWPEPGCWWFRVESDDALPINEAGAMCSDLEFVRKMVEVADERD